MQVFAVQGFTRRAGSVCQGPKGQGTASAGSQCAHADLVDGTGEKDAIPSCSAGKRTPQTILWTV